MRAGRGALAAALAVLAAACAPDVPRGVVYLLDDATADPARATTELGRGVSYPTLSFGASAIPSPTGAGVVPPERVVRAPVTLPPEARGGTAHARIGMTVLLVV